MSDCTDPYFARALQDGHVVIAGPYQYKIDNGTAYYRGDFNLLPMVWMPTTCWRDESRNKPAMIYTREEADARRVDITPAPAWNYEILTKRINDLQGRV